jgi:hypothetical protein
MGCLAINTCRAYYLKKFKWAANWWQRSDCGLVWSIDKTKIQPLKGSDLVRYNTSGKTMETQNLPVAL